MVKVQNPNHYVPTLAGVMRFQLLLSSSIIFLSCGEQTDSIGETKEEITIGVMSPENAPKVEFDHRKDELLFLKENDSLIKISCNSNKNYIVCEDAIWSWYYYRSEFADSPYDIDLAIDAAQLVYELVYTDSGLSYWQRLALLKTVGYKRQIIYSLQPLVGDDISKGKLENIHPNLVHQIYGIPANYPQYFLDYLQAHPYKSNVGIIQIGEYRN